MDLTAHKVSYLKQSPHNPCHMEYSRPRNKDGISWGDERLLSRSEGPAHGQQRFSGGGLNKDQGARLILPRFFVYSFRKRPPNGVVHVGRFAFAGLKRDWLGKRKHRISNSDNTRSTNPS